ncbi:MAG: GNAT family N-acetyltransferase [Armatimonadota bacterium]|nr:MAG: GNAT family N-acetyltransferase [Armatimonadota bacterium]
MGRSRGCVQSTVELSGDDLDRLVEFLSCDARGNALILADMLTLPEVCDVRALCGGESWTVGAFREDLPFRNIALSSGNEEEYRRMIEDFSDRFRPGDLIYSLIPGPQTEVLGRIVEIGSKTPEIQLFRELSTRLPRPEGLESLKAKGFRFRVLGRSDLDAVRRVMEVGERFAFAEGSFRKGVYWGAFRGRRLVCVVGTHSLGRHAAEIGNLVTLPEYRRQGLAKACLSLLLCDLSKHTSCAYLSFFAQFGFLERLFGSVGFVEPRPFDLVAWHYPNG